MLGTAISFQLLYEGGTFCPAKIVVYSELGSFFFCWLTVSPGPWRSIIRISLKTTHPVRQHWVHEVLLCLLKTKCVVLRCPTADWVTFIRLARMFCCSSLRASASTDLLHPKYNESSLTGQSRSEHYPYLHGKTSSLYRYWIDRQDKGHHLLQQSRVKLKWIFPLWRIIND